MCWRLLASQFATDHLTIDLMIMIFFQHWEQFIYHVLMQNDNELHLTSDKKEEIKNQV